MRRQVFIVPHTHWDREWYSPFQSFRLRLVDLFDDLLPLLENCPSYRHFLVDGQMAVIDDYLEVRPNDRDRIKSLALEGRVSMGPWYILLDEFLVSGETIIRDLQLGMKKAQEFGGAMKIGYLPDMFGHIAQMPQILKLAGLSHAVVWRGVPSQVDRRTFNWVSLDGSSVVTEFLPMGYGNGAGLPDDAESLIARVKGFTQETDFLTKENNESILLMNGTDHQKPQPWLGQVVKEANETQDEYEFSIVSLSEAIEHSPKTNLPAFKGELRSGWRSNLLMGVTSNRVDVRLNAFNAEFALEKLAEPLSSIFADPDKYPESLLDIAWKNMILNSAHDSICACSVDDVVDQVLVRFKETQQIATGISTNIISEFTNNLSHEGPVALNMSNRQRSGIIEFMLPGTVPPPGTQLLFKTGSAMDGTELVLTAAEVSAILVQLNGQSIDDHTFIAGVMSKVVDNNIEILIKTSPELNPSFSADAAKRDIAALLSLHPNSMVHVKLEGPNEMRLLGFVNDVPGYGYLSWNERDLIDPVSTEVTDENIILKNLTVETLIDKTSGTFTLNGVSGMNRLVDMGDHGDTYNYSPPDNDKIVDTPISVEINVIEQGPVRAIVDVIRTYEFPSHIDSASRSRVGTLETEITSRLELRTLENIIRITTSFKNMAKDHRLRAHFPLPFPSAYSQSETAFGVVTRGLQAEGGISERGLPTFPSLRFVTASNLTIVHRGVSEYEMVGISSNRPNEANEIALTIARCTGMLSQITMAYRPLSAGPPIPVKGPQLEGYITSHYAISVGENNPYVLADNFLNPLICAISRGMGTLPPTGHYLSISGVEVSSIRRVSGNIEIRIFNPTDAQVTADFGTHSGYVIDLAGKPLYAFNNALNLSPWTIVTVRLEGTYNKSLAVLT